MGRLSEPIHLDPRRNHSVALVEITSVSLFPLDAERCGFSTAAGVVGMPPKFELGLLTVLKDGSCVPLGAIRGRHRVVHSTFQPTLQPLMVNNRSAYRVNMAYANIVRASSNRG